MVKKVVMFPGQGSQKIGMGSNLLDKYSDLERTASNICGFSIKELCINGPVEQLNNTKYTQPTLYVINHLSYLDYLTENSEPNYLIGHSLGEYNALTAANAMDFETGLNLVKQRGSMMSEVMDGGMSAIIGLKISTLADILKQEKCNTVDMANINAPNQIVVAGPVEQLEIVEHYAKENGAKMAVRLKVSGSFHSRYMKPLAQQFKKIIDDVEFSEIQVPVIANINGEPYINKNIGECLTVQLYSSVEWVKTIHYLKSQHVETFNEVGPGKVLTGLLRHFR